MQMHKLENFPRDSKAEDPSKISALWEEYSRGTKIAGRFLPGNDVYSMNSLNNDKQVIFGGKTLVKSQYVIKGISNCMKQEDVMFEIDTLLANDMLVAWAETEIRSRFKPRYLIVIKCSNCVPSSVPLSNGVSSKTLRNLRCRANKNINFPSKFNA